MNDISVQMKGNGKTSGQVGEKMNPTSDKEISPIRYNAIEMEIDDSPQLPAPHYDDDLDLDLFLNPNSAAFISCHACFSGVF